MWRVSRSLLRTASSSAAGRGASGARRLWPPPPCALQRCSPSRGYASLPGAEAARGDGEEEVTPAEARRLMRLANVDVLKRQLGDGEVIPYADLLRVCQEAGAARTRAEAAALAGPLDRAGPEFLGPRGEIEKRGPYNRKNLGAPGAYANAGAPLESCAPY